MDFHTGHFSRISQLFDIAAHYLLHGNRPLLASLKLTYRCNLGCQQCPFYTMSAPDLIYLHAIDLIDRLYERGNRLLMFEGGEPFLWQDGTYRLRDLVQFARQRFFSVGVTTNGTQPLDVPSDVLWVSVDGLRETHDALCGTHL